MEQQTMRDILALAETAKAYKDGEQWAVSAVVQLRRALRRPATELINEYQKEKQTD